MQSFEARRILLYWLRSTHSLGSRRGHLRTLTRYEFSRGAHEAERENCPHHRGQRRDRRGHGHGFCGEGARLLLAARRAGKLAQVASRALERGAAAVHSIDLDVRNRHAVQRAIDELPEEWAEIDILVNNAGLSRGMEKLYTGRIEDWEEMIDTNIKGMLYVARAVVPGMVVRGRGHVVNLGSTAGEMVYPNGAVYCATKAAERVINDGCARTCWARRCA